MNYKHRPLFPRLANNSLCEIGGIRYQVGWWSDGKYEFTCIDEEVGKHHGKFYTESQVSEGIKAGKIKEC